MILDYNYLFDVSASDTTQLTGVAVTGISAAGLASTNVIDLVNARNMGVGDSPALKVMTLVTAAFTTTGTASTTVTISFQGAPTNTAGASWVTYAQSAAYASASLTAGAKISFDVPPINPQDGPLPRFLRLVYTLGGPGSTFSAGSVISGIVLQHDQNRGYPPGTTVVN